MLLLPLYITLPAVYAEDLGLGYATVGAALFAARLWDVGTDPVIGILSDRWRPSFGRRKPWLVIGAPLVLISAGLLFQPGPGVGTIDLLVWVSLLYLGVSAILVPYTAWGAELSGDYHERSRIAGWREALALVGTLVAAALPALLTDNRLDSLASYAWLIWLVLPPCLLAAVIVVPDPKVRPAPRSGWRVALRTLWRNGPFRLLIGAYFLNGIANGVPAGLFLLYVEHVLQAESWSGQLLLVYFLSGVIAIPGWLYLARRFDKRRVWTGAMIWAAAVFACVPLLGPGDQHWFLVVCILTGISLGADLTLPASMQADVIDLDQVSSRQCRAGIYFALWGVATKSALAVAVGLTFPLLELAGFAGENSGPGALFALAGLYSLLPAGIKLVAVALVWRFPITRDRQQRLRRLIERRAACEPGG